jgi:hypothetical protein
MNALRREMSIPLREELYISSSDEMLPLHKKYNLTRAFFTLNTRTY